MPTTRPSTGPTPSPPLTPAVRHPLTLQRNAVLASLLVLAAAAWVVLIWQATAMGDMPMGLMMGLTAPLFLTIWVVMMVAMMFPTAAPMVLMFHQVHAGKRARGEPFVSTWVFVGAYMAVWAFFGVLAYAGARGAQELATGAHLASDVVGRIGGGVLLGAGLYQLSPLKGVCLAKCRTPLMFIMTAWRDGVRGTIRMGLEHGVYCLGCCWLLFVILFPLGVMNIAAMAVITLVIFGEKSLSTGLRISQVAAVALVVYGAAVLASPSLLPTFMPTTGEMSSPTPGMPGMSNPPVTDMPGMPNMPMPESPANEPPAAPTTQVPPMPDMPGMPGMGM